MKAEIIKTHPFIDARRSKGFQYYIIPKAMLRRYTKDGVDLPCKKDSKGEKKEEAIDLSVDEVILYAVLKDRANLSYKNHWVTSDGRVYLYFKREEAMKFFGWSKHKTIDAFNHLKDVKLLDIETRTSATGLNVPNRYYVRQWVEPSEFRPLEKLLQDGFPYITEKTLFGTPDSYYILPKCLLEEEIYEGLGLRALLLYAIALDTIHLSIANNRVDANGLVWCILDTDETAKKLKCSTKTLYGEYKTLENSGLMVRIKDPINGFTRVYLRDYLPTPADPEAVPDGQTEENAPRPESFAPPVSQSCTSGKQKMHPCRDENAPPEGASGTASSTDLHFRTDDYVNPKEKNLHPNKNYYPSSSNLPYSNSIMPAAAGVDAAVRESRDVFEDYYERYQHKTELVKAEYRKQIDYDSLVQDIEICETGSMKMIMIFLLDRCMDIMVEDKMSKARDIRVGTALVDKEEQLIAYASLTRYPLYALLHKIAGYSETSNGIRDIDAYLRKALSTAFLDYEGVAVYMQRDILQKRKEHQMRLLGADMPQLNI